MNSTNNHMDSYTNIELIPGSSDNTFELPNNLFHIIIDTENNNLLYTYDGVEIPRELWTVSCNAIRFHNKKPVPGNLNFSFRGRKSTRGLISGCSIPWD